MASVYPIVEGQGDEIAVPVLIRRLATEELQLPYVQCFRPYRLPRSRLLDSREFARALALIRPRLRQAQSPSLVLVLMDADDDCPIELAERVRAEHAHGLALTQHAIVFAVREYESWFLASNLDETDHRDLRPVTPRFDDPEGIRDAKGRFEREFLKDGRTYSETADQVKFSKCLRIDNAKRAPSFAKLVRDLRAALVR